MDLFPHLIPPAAELAWLTVCVLDSDALHQRFSSKHTDRNEAKDLKTYMVFIGWKQKRFTTPSLGWRIQTELTLIVLKTAFCSDHRLFISSPRQPLRAAVVLFCYLDQLAVCFFASNSVKLSDFTLCKCVWEGGRERLFFCAWLSVYIYKDI